MPGVTSKPFATPMTASARAPNARSVRDGKFATRATDGEGALDDLDVVVVELEVGARTERRSGETAYVSSSERRAGGRGRSDPPARASGRSRW